MELNKRIESSIVDIFPLMTSSGSWPFMMIQMERENLKELSIEPALKSSSLLLILLRTDFSDDDLLDYAKNTKEYSTLPAENRQAYLQMFKAKAQNPLEMARWVEMVTGLATGLVMQLARSRDVYFDAVEADLSEMDSLARFDSKNLKAYQLFNAYLID